MLQPRFTFTVCPCHVVCAQDIHLSSHSHRIIASKSIQHNASLQKWNETTAWLFLATWLAASRPESLELLLLRNYTFWELWVSYFNFCLTVSKRKPSQSQYAVFAKYWENVISEWNKNVRRRKVSFPYPCVFPLSTFDFPSESKRLRHKYTV
jgi:hypothetical protein